VQKRDVNRLQQELEELFSDMWQVPGFAGLRRGFRPHVDCYRSDDPAAVTVVVDLAGVDPDDVDIVVGDRAVVISGERRRAELACRVSYWQMEIEYGPFQRRIALVEDVDADRAEATYEAGQLKIVLPLAQRRSAGRISISLEERGTQGQA
jgi:HSP20 family protein